LSTTRRNLKIIALVQCGIAKAVHCASTTQKRFTAQALLSSGIQSSMFTTYVALFVHIALLIMSSDEYKMNWCRYASSSLMSADVDFASSISKRGSFLLIIMNTTIVYTQYQHGLVHKATRFSTAVVKALVDNACRRISFVNNCAFTCVTPPRQVLHARHDYKKKRTDAVCARSRVYETDSRLNCVITAAGLTGAGPQALSRPP
jgi:hypothetical protein